MYFTLGMLKANTIAGVVSGFPAIAENIFNIQTSSPYRAFMPATINVDDLLIILTNQTSGTGAPTGPPTGWTEMSGSGHSGYYRWATGTEAGKQIVVPTSGSGQYLFTVLRITGADPAKNPEYSFNHMFSTSAPDPSALDPSWPDANNLFILGICANEVRNVTTYPAGYTLYHKENDGSSGSSFIAAKTAIVSTSENPAAFALSGTADCFIWTIAIKGA